MRHLCYLLAALFAAGLLLGCADDNPLNRQAVSGRITLDGVPLDQGTIEFSPQAKGSTSSGALIKDGNYEIEELKGLPPGEYLVRIFSAEAEQGPPPEGPPGPMTGPPPKERIPAAYSTESDKVVKVTEGEPAVFNFDIKSE